jgi:hypothetical protein
MTTDSAAVTTSPTALDGMLTVRPQQTYNPAEQRFSMVVQQRLHELLEGDCNDVLIMRLYPHRPERLGVMGTPPSVKRAHLRIPVVQRMLEDLVRFLADGPVGGQMSQERRAGGRIAERQSFPTRYPHIVIEREDLFAAGGRCEQTTLNAVRVQNQRVQTQINRLLDIANLDAEVGATWLA